MRTVLKVVLCVFGGLLLISLILPAFSGVSLKSRAAIDSSDGKQIALGLEKFAEDNEGHLPPTLQGLVPKYLSGDFMLPVHVPLSDWHYFPDAPKNDLEAIVLVSPRIYYRQEFEVAPLDSAPHGSGSEHWSRLIITLHDLGPKWAETGKIIPEPELTERLRKQQGG